jgi:hypothetical protein
MHSYSTNESRVPVYTILAIIALVVAWIIGWLTSFAEWPQWIAGAPSFGAVFGGMYRLFDVRIWNTSFARRLGLVKVEDLNGTYEGELISTFKLTSGKPVNEKSASTSCKPGPKSRLTWRCRLPPVAPHRSQHLAQ